MKQRNFTLLFVLSLTLFMSCSSDDSNDGNTKITPPNYILGTWISSSSIPQLNGTIKYTFSDNNLIEEGVFQKNNGDPFTVNYGLLFSSDEFTIEEELTDNSYTICVSYSSGEIDFYEDTNFRIPNCRRFDLVSENLLSAPSPHTGLALIKQ